MNTPCGAARTPPPTVGTPIQLESAVTIYDMPLMHMRYGAQGTHQTFSCRAIRHRFTASRPKPCRTNWLTLGRKRGATSAGATDSQPTPTGDAFLSHARMEGWVGDGFGMQHHRPNPAHSGHGLISQHTLARPRSWRSAGPGWLAGQARRGPMRPFRGWSSRVPPLLCAGVEP